MKMLQISLELNISDIELPPACFSRQSGKDIDLENLEKSSGEKYQLALTALLALRANGYQAMYGWKKGDGFWVSAKINEKEGHTVRLENSLSGNPYFLLTSEALLLAKQFPNLNT